MRCALVVLLAACGADPPADEHAGHVAPAPTGHEGHTAPAIEVAPDVVELLAIRTEPASSGEVGVARRAPAQVGWDPLAVTRVTVQAGGQVRDLRLPRPGEPVAAGEVIARIYQPDIRAAFEELRVAAELGEPWLGAARSRLVASGVSPTEVARALSSGVAPDTFAIRAPASGVVLEHLAKEGAWVAPGGVIGVLGDPDALVVDLVVSGAPPAPDTPVALRDPASGRTWPATVASVLPTADAAGMRVRVLPSEAPPVGLPLVAEWTDAGTVGTWVPRTAVVDTGARRVVFVEIAPGRFEPRDVELGAAAGDRIQVTRGVAPGEAVVVSGTFLLDSETQIGAGGHAGHGGM